MYMYIILDRKYEENRNKNNRKNNTNINKIDYYIPNMNYY